MYHVYSIDCSRKAEKNFHANLNPSPVTSVLRHRSLSSLGWEICTLMARVILFVVIRLDLLSLQRRFAPGGILPWALDMASQSSEKKYIYVLRLRQNKWYIGSTTNVQQRIAQHFDGTGSAWTSRFPPIEIFDVVTQRDGWHEENLTKEYMLLYGLENVRGGPYTSLEFTEEEEAFILRALDSFRNACFYCGSTDHMASSCPNTSVSSSEGDEQVDFRASQECLRCGRSGHSTSDCYATTDVNGTLIESFRRSRPTQSQNDNSFVCFRCGRLGHFASDCYATTDVNGTLIESFRRSRPTQSQNDNSFVCFRCGRLGHFASDCYATTDVNGTLIESLGRSRPTQNQNDNSFVCFRCGRLGHFASECYFTTDVNGARINSPRRSRPTQSQNDSSFVCFRCRRSGHFASECYATTDVNGARIDSPRRCKSVKDNVIKCC